MDIKVLQEWVAPALLIAAMFLFPKWFSFRRRAIAGIALFPLGWAGIFGGLALGNRPFMQSEAVAGAWMGISALTLVLSITLLVPVFNEWRRKRRKPGCKAEIWRAGHRKS